MRRHSVSLDGLRSSGAGVRLTLSTPAHPPGSVPTGTLSPRLLVRADEIIRQVTIGCSERGLLLARVRDEAKTTIAALDTQYESCVAFGIRKALLAEQRKSELRARVSGVPSARALLDDPMHACANASLPRLQWRSIDK